MGENKPVIMKNGIGLGTIAFVTWLVFFILKLAGVIDWHWAVVFLPLIIWGGLVVVTLLLFALCILLYIILDSLQ